MMATLIRLADSSTRPDEPRIVVGIDGSEPSFRALERALGEARQASAVIDVVTAWSFPMVRGYALTHSPHDVDENAKEVLEAAVNRVSEEAPELVVRSEATEGEAGPVLVDAALGAELLVVGARGLGGFRRLLLGSVSSYCAQHAACSVLIVR
jgi:nucleotide-binding universal stress UspA family protein